MRYFLLLSVFFLQLPLSFATNDVYEVIDGRVYAGFGKATSGETVYFGLEYIDDNNVDKWRTYSSQTDLYKGKLYLSKRLFSPKTRKQNDNKITGFTDEEYEEFCDLIHQRWLDKDNESVFELRDNFHAATGQLLFNSNYYVAYVSKTPIVGYFDHPDECVTLKGYHSGYENLLMIVRSIDIPGTKVFNNRGIFRHPRSIIEGGYSGLSLKLHGFTAKCFDVFFGKTHMSVAPLPKMLKILSSNVEKKDIYMYPNIPSDLDHFEGMYGMLDTKCVVSVEALKKL